MIIRVICMIRSISQDSLCRLIPSLDNKRFDTWWMVSPRFVASYLAVLGFTKWIQTNHKQSLQGTMVELFTIVARRLRQSQRGRVSSLDPADLDPERDAEDAPERVDLRRDVFDVREPYEHAPEHDGIRRALQRMPGSRNVN